MSQGCGINLIGVLLSIETEKVKKWLSVPRSILNSFVEQCENV